MELQRRALKLAGDLIPRMQRRLLDQRSEERHSGLVDRAVIVFRGQEYIVPVINISSRGTMIECDILPRIGETIIVRFEHCSPIQAFVRWVRDGRLGLNFGHEIILG
ncbi:MAG TPA: PilZ domain-containing protein [Allosphingosinicella sp.]|nr:PilZ domain-containing protein [Allosphingosinicella sp.]